MDISTILVTFVAISGVVTAATTFAKSLLTQYAGFADPKNAGILSLILQLIAFAVGFLTAFSAGVNLLAAFPPYANASPLVGDVIIGFACLLGGQGGYVLISILAGHVVQPAAEDASAPAAYIPFLVVPRASLRAAFVGETASLATLADVPPIPHSANLNSVQTPSADDAVIGIHG